MPHLIAFTFGKNQSKMSDNSLGLVLTMINILIYKLCSI